MNRDDAIREARARWGERATATEGVEEHDRSRAEPADEVARLRSALPPRERDSWAEEDGPVLWWKLPIVEPPYVGTPLDDNFPEYVTHWTPLQVPGEPIEPVCDIELVLRMREERDHYRERAITAEQANSEAQATIERLRGCSRDLQDIIDAQRKFYDGEIERLRACAHGDPLDDAPLSYNPWNENPDRG